MIRNGQTVAQSLYSPPAYSLTVVIPAYKEELRIEKMLTNTIRYLEKRAMETPKFKAEIIIVDDGSTDKTVGKVKEVTKKLSPPLTDVKLISFPYNQGKGAAISEVEKHITNCSGKFCFFREYWHLWVKKFYLLMPMVQQKLRKLRNWRMYLFRTVLLVDHAMLPKMDVTKCK